MISYEEFETLVDLLKKSYEESRRFNKALEEVYGQDSSVWYYTQYDIIIYIQRSIYIIDIYIYSIGFFFFFIRI